MAVNFVIFGRFAKIKLLWYKMADGINLQKLNPQNRFLGKFAKFTALEKRCTM